MKEKRGEHPFGDTGQLIGLALFLIVWVSDSFFLKYSTFLAVYIPVYIHLFIALIPIVVSLYLLKVSHVVIKGHQRPETVLTSGAFKYIRHPLYTSAILLYVGLAVSTVSLLAFALFAVVFIFYNYIAHYEEKLMELKFGEDYKAYMQKTGKWKLLGYSKYGHQHGYPL